MLKLLTDPPSDSTCYVLVALGVDGRCDVLGGMLFRLFYGEGRLSTTIKTPELGWLTEHSYDMGDGTCGLDIMLLAVKDDYQGKVCSRTHPRHSRPAALLGCSKLNCARAA